MSDNATPNASANTSAGANNSNVNNQAPAQQQVQEPIQQQQQVQQQQGLFNGDVYDTQQYANQSLENNQQVVNEQEQQADNDVEEIFIPDEYEIAYADGTRLNEQDQYRLNQVFKDCGLTQEQATKLFSAYSKSITDFQGQANACFKQITENWKQQTLADKELGGANEQTTRLNISRVMQRYGNPELSQYLNETGLGYNPAFVRFISRLGASIGNDNNFINGNGGSPVSSDRERLMRMYPNSPELWGK